MELGVMVGALVDGLGLSAWIFVVTLVGSLPLGIVVALCRMSSFKPLSLLAQFYISILRGTPLMLQLMAFMFGPYYLLGMNMGTDWKFGACAVGFILNYSAYFAEIYRSGIQSIPKGQYEAALVLGYSRSQTFFKIVLPQVIKPGKRYFFGICIGYGGNVLGCQGPCRKQRVYDPLCHCCAYLLGVLPLHRIHFGARGKEACLLPRLAC